MPIPILYPYRQAADASVKESAILPVLHLISVWGGRDVTIVTTISLWFGFQIDPTLPGPDSVIKEAKRRNG